MRPLLVQIGKLQGKKSSHSDWSRLDRRFHFFLLIRQVLCGFRAFKSLFVLAQNRTSVSQLNGLSTVISLYVVQIRKKINKKNIKKKQLEPVFQVCTMYFTFICIVASIVAKRVCRVVRRSMFRRLLEILGADPGFSEGGSQT